MGAGAETAAFGDIRYGAVCSLQPPAGQGKLFVRDGVVQSLSRGLAEQLSQVHRMIAEGFGDLPVIGDQRRVCPDICQDPFAQGILLIGAQQKLGQQRFQKGGGQSI